MKKLGVFCLLGLFILQTSAQTRVLIPKWSPFALAAGKISLGAEWQFRSRHSLTFQVGLPVTIKHQVTIDGETDNARFKGLSGLAGYRFYVGRSPYKGFYLEPYFKYLKEEMSGRFEGSLLARKALFDTRIQYEAVGLGAQLGAQFLVGKNVMIDLYFLGPEANASNISGKSTDVANNLPWTSLETQEAERTARDAINDIPFLKEKTNIHADQQTKTISGKYNGFLPGCRVGVAFGIRL